MITIIAAIGKNGELGKNNNLLWQLPSDLKFFKEQTMGATVAMGKNTFESLPKILPGRKHIILSFDNNFNKDIKDSEVFNQKDLFISRCSQLSSQKELFIIGGASIYAMFIDIADKLVLTEIDSQDESADVYFPKFNKENYNMKVLKKNSDNGIYFQHVIYTKK
ncbi:MAG: dihydrofolate reductase [Clostridia bacterium]